MHELSIVQSVLQTALDAAMARDALSVCCVRIRVGALAGVVSDSLQFAFEVLREGTLASNATLLVEEVPAECVCKACDTRFEPPSAVYACPGCGALSATVLHGRELEIASVELELPGPEVS